MPTLTPSTAVPVKSRIRPPDLGSRRHFVRLRSVPVIDVNSRKYRKGGRIVEEVLGERQLRRICRNSRERAARGEYGLVFLGHTTDDGKEVDQPPVVGYLDNYLVGEHNGRPTILADAYIYRDANPKKVLRQFPRRSAEVIGLEERDGYVDALSLIKRAPERDLGLITHYALNHDASRESGSVVRFRSSDRVHRFQCPPDRFCEDCPDPKGSAMPMPAAATPRSGKMAKHLMHMLQEVVMGILEEAAVNPAEEAEGGLDAGADGLGDEPSGLGDEGMGGEDFGDDEMGDEPAGEEEGFEPSEPGEEAAFEEGEEEGAIEEEEEPELHGRKRHRYHDDPSRYSKMDPSDPSEDPSEPMPEQMRKHGAPSRHGAAPDVNGSSKVSKPKAETPSRHSAGQAGAYTADPGIGAGKRRPSVPGTKSRLRKEGREVTRMDKDSERIATSRYEKRFAAMQSEIDQLRKERDDAKATARRSSMERRVIQLEGEGFILDRAKTVRRFMRCTTADELNEEMADIRRYGRQSPVSQPMLPDVWEGVGGAGERAPDPREEVALDVDNQGIEIIGSRVARFAAQADDKLGELSRDDLAIGAVSRYRESRKVSRGRRDDAQDN